MSYSNLLKFLGAFITVCLLLSSCEEGEGIRITCADADGSCTDTSITIDTSKSGRKVLIIGIDGFRVTAVNATTAPFMYQLSLSDSTFYNPDHSIEDYTFSGPNWSSLATGVNWCKHQVTSNDFANNDLADYPGFFSYIERADSRINTASVVNWLPINENLMTPFADYAPLNSIDDSAVYQLAEDLLVRQDPVDPDVLFLQFDELDGAGHSYGFHEDVAEYAQTLQMIDGHVAVIFSIIINKRQAGEDWMVFIISDHGGDGTSHSGGQDNEFINRTIFFINHPTIRANRTVSSQVDLVPTALSFLGISSVELSCKADGLSLID